MAKQARRLNKRFVTLLTIGIMMVLTIIIALVIIATANRDPKIYSDKADACMAKGNYEEAARNFGKAYSASKRDPKWLVKLAEAQYRIPDERRALVSLHQAVIADATLVAAQKRLVEIYFELIGREGPVAQMKQLGDEADRLIKMIPEKAAAGNPELKKALALGYHCRGVARYGQRSQDPALQALALEDITKAISLEASPDYVASKAMIYLGDAAQMARATQSEGVTPEMYDTYLEKMRDKIREAEKLYRDLAASSRDNPEVYVALGNFYFQMSGSTEVSLANQCHMLAERLRSSIERQRQGLASLESSTTGSPDERRRIRQRMNNQILEWQRDIPSWESRSRKQDKSGRELTARAREYLAKAVALADTKGTTEEKISARLALARYDIPTKAMAEAEKLAREAVALDPTGYPAYRMLSEILRYEAESLKGPQGQAKNDEAIKTLARRVQEIPPKLQGIKGRQNRLMRLELIAQMAELYLNRNKPGDMAQADKAIKELEESEVAGAPALCMLKARRAMAADDLNQSIKLLEKADRLSNERNVQAKLLLGQLYLNSNAVGAAKKEVDAILAMTPDNVMAWRMAAMVYLRLGEYATALGYAERLQLQKGLDKDAGTLKVKLECLVRMNRLNEADAVAKKLAGLGEDLRWPVQKARLMLMQGKTKEGEALLTGVLKEKPGDKLATIYLVELYGSQDRMAEAQALVKEAIARNPKDVELKYTQELISIQDPRKRAERLQALTKEAVETKLAQGMARAEEEKDPYLRAIRLVDQYLRRNDLAKAKQAVDEALKQDPKKANFLSFRIGLVAKDWDRAQKALEVARRENLDSVQGLTYEVELAGAQGWDVINSGTLDEARKESAKKYFVQSAKAAEQILPELPNDAQTHALLGEAYYWLDRRGEAASQINQALTLSPSNPYALRAASLRQWEEIALRGALASPELVRSFSENIQSAFQQMPLDPWLKDKVSYVRQQVAKQQEYRSDVTENVEKVLARREARRKEKPNDVENLVRLAAIYEGTLSKAHARVRDADKADACYRQALEQDPRGELVDLYLRFADRNKRLGGTETFMKELAARQAKSGKGVGYSLLGFYYMKLGMTGKSEAAFLEAVKVEDSATKDLDMAVFYARTDNPEKTADWCRRALNAKPTRTQDRTARSLMIDSLLATTKWDQAKAQIEEYQKLNSGSEGQVFQARLALGQGQISEAERILTDMLTGSPENMAALDFRATVYLYTWQLEKARKDLEQIQRINPNGFGWGGQIKLIKLACELGRTADAERDARDLINRAMSQSLELVDRIRMDLLPPLASALSETTYDELLIWAGNKMPQYWGWPYERGQFFVLRGRYDQAVKAYQQAWGLLAGAPKAMTPLKLMILDGYLGAVYKTTDYGRYDQITQITEKALPGLSEGTSRVLAWQAAAYYAKGNAARGRTVFLKALAASDGGLQTWELTRETMLTVTKARDLARDLEDASTTATTSKRIIPVALATCYFASDAVDKGAKMLRQLAEGTKEAKEKAVLLYILGQEYTEKHQYPEALAALNEAKQAEPTNTAVLNNIAYILEEYQNKPGDALAPIEEAYKQASNNADLLDTYGQVLFRTGKEEEGMFHMAKSVWVRESSSSRYHLGVMLAKRDRRSDAELQLRRALQLVGDDKTLEGQIRKELSKMSG
jgi:tetratricopeptide (TPR) repeat protein